MAAKLSRAMGVIVTGGLSLLAMVAPAAASPVLDFLIFPNIGTYSYAGGTTPLVGTGIGVDSVVGITTPTPNPPVALTGTCGGFACLNLTTGNFLSTGPGPVSHFAAGGSITLVGGAPSLGIPNGTTLFSGSFTQQVNLQITGSQDRDIVTGIFLDTKLNALAANWGLSGGATPYSGLLSQQFVVSGSPVPPTSFTSDLLLGGDVSNTPLLVAEPSAILLLGSGMVGLGVMARRRRRRTP